MSKSHGYTMSYLFRDNGKDIRQYQHIVICESVLGHTLPKGAVVHHVDGDGLNNSKDNLVICQSIGYHKLLHRRKRALEATGDKLKIRCCVCKSWLDQSEMVGKRTSGKCKPCHAKAEARRKEAAKHDS